MKTKTQSFEMVIDGLPYIVSATPFLFNDETRFRVSFNGSPVHIFVLDTELGRLTAIGDDSVTIPESLEEAIAAKLQSSIVENNYV
ncbi:MAG: hypothetical protein H7Y27_09665 [Gemmatimonadaceae bacterium]|nr:hypothetical protein [Chitinophagaceae bacterium]